MKSVKTGLSGISFFAMRWTAILAYVKSAYQRTKLNHEKHEIHEIIFSFLMISSLS